MMYHKTIILFSFTERKYIRQKITEDQNIGSFE